MRKSLIVLPAAALLLSFSCEKDPAPPTAPEVTPPAGAGEGEGAEGGETAEPEEAAAPKTWADMDRKARLALMGTQVLPKMKEAFQTHDGENFKEFKCQTCHGDDMKEVDFKMPNAITPLGADPIASGKEIDEETTKFMVEVVVPQMAEMLSLEVQDDGLGAAGCFSCHLKEE